MWEEKPAGSAICVGSRSSAALDLLIVWRMPAVLRNFLYLDERLTSQYLAQLEGGIYEEEAQSTTDSRAAGGKAGIKAGPASAEGSRSRGGEETTSRTVQQTPEGNYRRLEKLLVQEDAVQELFAFDDGIWEQLSRGEVLSIEANVGVAALFTFTGMASSIGPIVELMRSFGQQVDGETTQAISSMAQLDDVLKEIPVVARPVGSPKYKFICPLKRQYLRDELAALNGDCIVVGTLQRHLARNESYSVLDSLGMGSLPRADRRKMDRDLKKGKGEMGELVISAPAVVLTPLAVYR
jgi:hypothetical protein